MFTRFSSTVVHLPELRFQCLFYDVTHFAPGHRSGDFEPLVQGSGQIERRLLLATDPPSRLDAMVLAISLYNRFYSNIDDEVNLPV